jgi:hypothetical protein
MGLGLPHGSSPWAEGSRGGVEFGFCAEAIAIASDRMPLYSKLLGGLCIMRYFHPVSEPHASGDKEGGVNPHRRME